MTNASSQAFSTIAQRMDNAVLNFVENIKTIAGCTDDEARDVLALYRKLRIVKMDAVNGRYDVKHGAFLDKQTIQNAIAQTRKEK